MLEKIDDFLLERMFQPVCDMLSSRISCYRLAVYRHICTSVVYCYRRTDNVQRRLLGFMPEESAKA